MTPGQWAELTISSPVFHIWSHADIKPTPSKHLQVPSRLGSSGLGSHVS
jgi:hypothetical protein